MDRVEDNLRLLLDGNPIDDNNGFCDFSLEEQNEASVSKGITPSAASDYKPIVKSTVTYVVVGVLINEEGNVLMMQEAKHSCAGQWYLPAGRVEPGEDLAEAAAREVLEETGLIMEPTTLLLVECASGSWYRFVFTGNVTGGRLKMLQDADSESLQANWVDKIEDLSLRSNDILPIIERARAYHFRGRNPWHEDTLSVIKPHKKLLMRLLVCIKKRSNNCLHILLSEKNEVHLPICEIDPTRNFHSTLKKFMIEIFGADVAPHKPHGLLSVEHSGKPENIDDGLCLTMLVSFRKPLEEVGIIDKYTWLEVSKNIGDEIMARLPRNMVVPLNVIR